MKPIEKTIESIKRNAEKINEHTWKVYKEQILAHIEDAEFEIANPAPPALDVEGLKNFGSNNHIDSCPHCGGMEGKDVILGYDHPKYRICCVPCNVVINDDRKDKVIANWNRRFNPAPDENKLQGLVDKWEVMKINVEYFISIEESKKTMPEDERKAGKASLQFIDEALADLKQLSTK